MRPRPRRVLVVDDDSRNAGTFEREWTAGGAAGWQVDVAESPADAERLAGTHTYDAAVVVHRLPHLDGFALSRRLRQTQPGAVRALICGHSDRARVLAAGADLHVAFPRRARPAHVEARLRAVLDARETAGLAANGWAALLSLDCLPTAVAGRQRVSALLRVRPFPRLAITDIVAADPGLAAVVFRAVNAPHYGLNRPVTDLPTAVTLLGPWAMAEIVSALERAAHRAATPDLLDGTLCDRAAARARAVREARLRSGAPGLAAERAYAEALLAEAPNLLERALPPTCIPPLAAEGAARALFALWGLPPATSTNRLSVERDEHEPLGLAASATHALELPR